MVKTLGVFVGNDRIEAGRRGFEEIKEKIKNKLKFWKGKGISLNGRIRILNTFVHDITNDIKTEIIIIII